MTDDRDFAKKITTYLDRGTAELRAGTAYKLQLARQAALARLTDPKRQTRAQWALAGAGTGTVGGAGLPVGRPAAGLGVLLVVAAVFGYPAVAGLPAAAGHRGNGRRDPVLGPADRRIPGPGIPELAEARVRRRLIPSAFALALAAGPAGSALAQPLTLRSPAWNELPPQEQQVLAPIEPEWGKLDAQRKQKWRSLAQRYPKMTPDEQQRIRQQMGAWVQLTPQQRAAAREQYKSMKQLPPEQKQDVKQKWEQYQTLPPETRRELAAKPVPPATPAPGANRVRPAPTLPPPPQLAPSHPPAGARRRPRCRGDGGVTIGMPPAAAGGAEPPATAHARLSDASLTRRLAALVYELLLYAALVLVVGFLTPPPLSPPAAPGVLRLPDLPARVLSFALVFGAGAVYSIMGWTLGRTLPMKTWHLRLVRADGAPVDRRTALVRYLAAWIGPALALVAFTALRPLGLGPYPFWLVALNFLWALVDPERRFLHDRLAGTRIVRAGQSLIGTIDRCGAGNQPGSCAAQARAVPSKRSMLSRISFFASSAPTQVEIRTHLPGSRSL